MEFSPINNSKIYEQVIDQIKKLIYEGKIKKGDKLPSERKLKEQLNVSRASIREAFSALEMLGLIESKSGEGTFIRKNPENKLLEPLSLILLLEENISEELVELRRALEVYSVSLASERATQEDIAEIKKYINALETSSGFEEKGIKADYMFHYTIAKASHNKVLYYTMVSISEAMDFYIKNARTKIISKEETMKVLLNQHKEICEAIEQGDKSKAREAMNNHLTYGERIIKHEIKS